MGFTYKVFSMTSIYMKYSYFILLSAFSSFIFTHTAFAQQDENYRLQQLQKLNTQQQLSEVKQQSEALLPSNTTPHTSQHHALQIDDERTLTYAIFASINAEQWDDLKYYLEQYQQLAEHSEVIVLFSQAVLARKDAQYELAEQKLQQLLVIDTDFKRGHLELARVLFENKKYQQAEQVFQTIRSQMPVEIQKYIDIYLNAIQKQKQWQGSLNIGWSYQNNINQKSNIEQCYDYFYYNGEKICSQLRSSDQSIADQAFNYQLILNKTIPIYKQHSLISNNVAYGTVYNKEREYTQHTLNTSLGYQYQNYLHQFSILPFIEWNSYHGQSLYYAYGGRIDYSYQINPKLQWNIQVEHQQNKFVQDDIAKQNNGDINSVYQTLQYQYTPSLWLFAGLNYLNKNIQEPYLSYEQWGARVGAYKVSQYGTLTAVLQYKSSQYKKENIFIDPHAAHNKEWIYSLQYAMPQYQFKGVYPSVHVKYQKMTSNIAWYYQYHAYDIGFKLQKNF